MLAHEPFDDLVLGRVTWNGQHNEWRFTLTLSDGRAVNGAVVPEGNRLPLHRQGLGEIRDCVHWVRDNERAIRQYIADQMFPGWLSGWYDEEIDQIATKEEFREAITLAGISVLEDRRATLCYDDANLFGGHAIVLSVGADGRFDCPPSIWG